jgi:CheY-like chemotaxis protein/uncharacterized membrane protein
MKALKKIKIIELIKFVLLITSFIVGVVFGFFLQEPAKATIIVLLIAVLILVVIVLYLFLQNKQKENISASVQNEKVDKFSKEIREELLEPTNEIQLLLKSLPSDKIVERIIQKNELIINLLNSLSVSNEDDSQPLDIPNLSGKTILVVDDISVNRSILAETLKLAHVEVLEAENGLEAFEVFEKNFEKLDAILMDIRMPEMNGYESTKKIRDLNEKGKHIPIIAITAHVFQEDVFKAFEVGMNDHLSKPIDLNQLFLALRKNLIK